MRQITKEDIARAIGGIVQPLFSGAISLVNGFSATMTGVVPFGGGQTYRMAFPFGLVSSPIPTTMAYMLNLGGSAMAPIVLAYLDKNRPAPSGPGETILYSLSADGSLVPVTLTLGADGTFTLAATTTNIGSADASSPLVLGDVLKTALDALIGQIGDAVSALNTFIQAVETGPIGGPAAVGVPVITSPGIVAAAGAASASLSAVATELTSIQEEYCDTAATNILSQSAFTERGA